MEKKYTPGEWAVFASDDRYPGIEAAGLSIIVYGTERTPDFGVQGETKEESLANAHLISSAPDLLEALENLSELANSIWVKMSDEEMRATKAAWDKADAAIRKAYGEGV